MAIPICMIKQDNCETKKKIQMTTNPEPSTRVHLNCSTDLANKLDIESNLHLVQSPDCCKSESRLGRSAEELKDRYGRAELLTGCLLHVNNGMCCLVDHHLAFVAQTALDEIVHWTLASELI